MNDPLLRVGDTSPYVRRLRDKLAAAGFLSPNPKQPQAQLQDVFDEALGEVIKDFQTQKGLDVDGICGPQTWAVLNEAVWKLGDRYLYLSTPMLRGDDVQSLQTLLGQLGFSAGREDGIFGPDTAQALEAFQKDNHLGADKICGPETIQALNQISSRARGENVASVKDREKLRNEIQNMPANPRLFIAKVSSKSHTDSKADQTLDLFVDNILASFRKEKLCEPKAYGSSEPSQIAEQANNFKANVCLGFKVSVEAKFQASYFATDTYESAGGKYLANLATEHISWALSHSAGFADMDFQVDPPVGKRIPLLRETKMWTVLCEFGPISLFHAENSELLKAFTKTLRLWFNKTDWG